ncbi:alpha-1,2-fucosyltransferase [Candidatus Parcubacteria bacterium]|nr:alpha-1,2-fucosyltransferase [Candidatus Parcubacteria bacterium]
MDADVFGFANAIKNCIVKFKMIISELMGGMGNQMFQYAFGKQLAIKNGSKLNLDICFLKSRKFRPNFVYRNYDLEIFNIEERFVSESISEKYGLDRVPRRGIRKLFDFKKLKYFQEPNMSFHPEALLLMDDTYISGYWQSERYFKDIEEQIRADFSFKEPISSKGQGLAETISGSQSVCLNVRRGDFLTDPILGVIAPEFYQNAVSEISRKLPAFTIYVFSDDIEWCCHNLTFNAPTQFVTHEFAGKKFRDYLELMILCKHFVIPNSTFAWWAAWLSKSSEKTVIAPKNWFRQKELNNHNIVPDSWITI